MFPDQAKRTERLTIISQWAWTLMVIDDLGLDIIVSANIVNDFISRRCNT